MYNYTNNQYAFVNGLEGAKSYPIPPNQTMLLMDNDNPLCYMKQCNNIGQTNLRIFKLIEIKESDLAPKQNQDIALLF